MRRNSQPSAISPLAFNPHMAVPRSSHRPLFHRLEGNNTVDVGAGCLLSVGYIG